MSRKKKRLFPKVQKLLDDDELEALADSMDGDGRGAAARGTAADIGSIGDARSCPRVSFAVRAARTQGEAPALSPAPTGTVRAGRCPRQVIAVTVAT